MFDYKGKVVFITGSSSGLGKQFAKAFAKQGADLVISARGLDKLEETKKELEELGARVLPVACDVTNTEQIDEAVNKIIEEFGKIDVLVNNAGGNKPGTVLDYEDDAWEFTINTDLNSVMKVSRRVGQEMVKQNYGRIINIASMYGLLGTATNSAAYHAAKGGVVNFTRAASAELAKHNITVNAICPGSFVTELTKASHAKKEFQDRLKAIVPLGRAGQEGELDGAVVFLGSEEASYVTGAILAVDGGWSSSK